MRWRARDAVLTSCLLALTPSCGGDDGTSNDGTSNDASADAAQGSHDAATSDARGDDGAIAPDDASTGDAGADAKATFALTSTGITPGAAIASTFTCAGTNVSPPLAWTGAPAGTKGYALVLTDLTNKAVHWVLWDMPPETASLPQDVPKTATLATPAGAKQSTSYDGTTHGYLGPCPNGTVHTYEFALYAMDVATLPGVTTATARNTVRDTILQHDLASATLSGTSDAKK